MIRRCLNNPLIVRFIARLPRAFLINRVAICIAISRDSNVYIAIQLFPRFYSVILHIRTLSDINDQFLIDTNYLCLCKCQQVLNKRYVYRRFQPDVYFYKTFPVDYSSGQQRRLKPLSHI